MKRYYLYNMNTCEVEALSGRTNLALLPVGPTEVHSIHLPTGTDIERAVGMSELVSDMLQEQDLIECLIAPAINYMPADCSNVFPGGTSIRPETAEAIVADVCVRISLIHSCITVAAWTGIGTAETLATASAIYGLSNGAIPYAPYCILIALALIICYVIFGGVMQLASLNMINGIVMIVGVFVAVFAVTPYLNAPFMAAESDNACRKGLFLAVGINGMSVVPWVVLGCVGVAIPALAKSTPNLIVMDLANLALPKPLVAIIMIALLCSTLSTGGASVMGNASVLVNDIIVPVFKPDMKDKTKLRLLRVASVGAGLLFLWPALHTPVLFPIFIWCFSFGVPVFVVYIMGLRYRMSKMAAWITIICGLGVNFWWTFWTPGFVQGTFFELNMYPVTFVSFGLGIILSIVLPGRPGWMRQLRDGDLDEDLKVKAAIVVAEDAETVSEKETENVQMNVTDMVPNMEVE